MFRISDQTFKPAYVWPAVKIGVNHHNNHKPEMSLQDVAGTSPVKMIVTHHKNPTQEMSPQGVAGMSRVKTGVNHLNSVSLGSDPPIDVAGHMLTCYLVLVDH